MYCNRLNKKRKKLMSLDISKGVKWGIQRGLKVFRNNPILTMIYLPDTRSIPSS